MQLSLGASVLGGGGYQIGLAAVAFSHGGGGAVGIAFAIQMMPLALASPFTSVLADRYPRRRVLVVIDVMRVTCTTSVALAVSQDAPLWVVLALGAPGAVASTAQQPATQALLPSLVADVGELTAANVVERGIVEAAGLAGPALAGGLLVVASPAAVFGGAAVGFGLSGLLVSRIAGGRETPRRLEVDGERRRDAALAGIRAIASDRVLALLIALATAFALTTGLVQVLVVLIARTLLHHGSSAVGGLFVAMGVGGLMGTGTTAMLVGRARLTVVVAASAALLVAGLGMVAVAPGDLTAPVGVATVGAAGVMGDVGVLTLLQRAVPEEVLARVFGAAGGVLIGTVGIGSLLAPALQHALGTREALAVAGVIPAIAITLGWPRLHRAEDPALDVSHRLKLLRRLEPFASLPATTLQELAASLRPLRAVAGESIVRQGEPAHDYFVLAAGACQAAVDGTIATVHHPGEGFGEIALVRDVPRTATVTAIQDSELYALRRSAFLGALARHAGATVAAEGTATARLARLRPRAGEAT